jgi:hypothetical protein
MQQRPPLMAISAGVKAISRQPAPTRPRRSAASTEAPATCNQQLASARQSLWKNRIALENVATTMTGADNNEKMTEDRKFPF